MMEAWEWPQWTYASLMVLSVMANAYLHGRPRNASYSGPGAIIGTAFTAFILYKGGFWS